MTTDEYAEERFDFTRLVNGTIATTVAAFLYATAECGGRFDVTLNSAPATLHCGADAIGTPFIFAIGIAATIVWALLGSGASPVVQS